jgi:hypothetical protein
MKPNIEIDFNDWLPFYAAIIEIEIRKHKATDYDYAHLIRLCELCGCTELANKIRSRGSEASEYASMLEGLKQVPEPSPNCITELNTIFQSFNPKTTCP